MTKKNKTKFHGTGLPAATVGATVVRSILTVRGEKVIIDGDLAALYGVSTKRLNEQVKRNRERFPEDFMFQLSQDEKDEVVANCDHLSRLKYSHSLPYVSTEHGAIMAASVLNTPRAIEMSVIVVRAFVRLRMLLTTQAQLVVKMAELERRLEGHDEEIHAIFEAVRQLMAPPKEDRKKIGFTVKEKQKVYAKSKVMKSS
ncbi:MAG: ORF6N domain-containing protein [Thermodesulfobacteriota bacterium]